MSTAASTAGVRDGAAGISGDGSNRTTPSSSDPSMASITQGGILTLPRQPQLVTFPWTISPIRTRQKTLSRNIAIGRASRAMHSITAMARNSRPIRTASVQWRSRFILAASGRMVLPGRLLGVPSMSLNSAPVSTHAGTNTRERT